MSSEFHHFAKAVEARFRVLAAEGELYQVEADDIFTTYLSFFPEGTNPIFRERTEHDCSCCKNFVRNLGMVVAIKGDKILTVWDVDKRLPEPYAEVAAAMATYVRTLRIKGIYRTKERKYGAQHTDELTDGGVKRWNHFFGDVPGKFVHAAPAQEIGAINTSMGVFRRGLEELTEHTLEQILDLIEANALYRGAEFKANVQGFLKLKREYVKHLDNIQVEQTWLWSHIRDRNALFRNTVIGTLAVDLDNGMGLEAAVRSFEQKVAPMNYKRPTALITPKMIEEGLAKLRDMGLESAIERRHAKLHDVSVNNVLFVDNHVRGLMKDGLAGLLMETVKVPEVSMKHAANISIADFLERAAAGAESIELLVENRHLSNFVSLTAPVDPTAGNLFKWDNNFAWSYDGDVADSVKARVKKAGGNVDADLRISLGWFNTDDLDLHVVEPNGNHISFMHKDGKLDVDMNNGFQGRLVKDAVENVSFVGKQVINGRYQVAVHNYRRRETSDPGFTLEVELYGALHQFQFPRAVSSAHMLYLEFRIRDRELVELRPLNGLIGGSVSQEKWGLKTGQLVRVNTLMKSPNHWDGNEVGNLHWFFMLEGALNPEPVRGIYNEFLKSELDPHRKVFEALGNKTKAPFAPEQLSGLGFSSTRGDTVSAVVRRNGVPKSFNIQF